METIKILWSSINWPSVLATILGSGIMVAFLEHFFARRRSREERASLLARDIYFRLQEKAEKILFGIYQIPVWEAKNKSTIAKKKLGSERKMYDVNWITRSIKRLRLSAAQIPKGNAMIHVRKKLDKDNRKVLKRRSPIIRVTGTL